MMMEVGEIGAEPCQNFGNVRSLSGLSDRQENVEVERTSDEVKEFGK